MIFRSATLHATILWIGLFSTPLCCQQENNSTQSESRFVDGVVVERKKYSFTVQGPDKQYTFKLNQLTGISARLIRPKIDWEKKSAVVSIAMSAPDGRAANNQTVQYKLPQKMYFRNRFSSQSKLATALTRSPIELRNLTITGQIDADASDQMTFSGPLELTDELNVLQTEINGQEKLIRPNLNVVRLEGFTIAELEPHTTEVFVNYGVEEGNLLARNIEFVRLADRSKIAQPNMPRVLIIGDSISFNYFAALHRFLRQEVNLFHPHANCLGTASHAKLHRWLGAYQTPGHQWDVIAFNFGHADSELSKSDYQQNLVQCIAKLKATGAKLIWIESTPVPFGFNDPELKADGVIPQGKRFDFEFEEASPAKLLPGRMRMQNKWAEETLKDYPDIQISKIWQVVKNDRRKVFAEWWFGKSLNFKNLQSQQIAAELAKSIRQLLN